MPALRHRTRLAVAAAIACLPLLLQTMPARATSRPAKTSSAPVTAAANQTSTTNTTTTTSSSSLSSSTTSTTSTTTTSTTTSTQTTSAHSSAGDQPVTLHVRSATVIHPAGDPSATIVDFSFSPGTITVHVGDTVTWTNQGKQPHTATANDGSFDTGTLKTGQSASHTFTKAGTFTYICSIHPFMHGTVVVQGSGGGSGTGSGTGSGSPGSGSSGTSGATTPSASTAGTPAPTATSATTSSGLPNTGMNVGIVLITAVALLGLGTVLRRRSTRTR